MSDPNFYIDGAKRMVAEGAEVASKIMAYMKMNGDKLDQLSPSERKKAVLEFEPAQMFNQIHPIVFQYLAVEGIFNNNAFRRYVMAVFGKPKSQEDQEYIQRDRVNAYYFKNKQQALYYKYLLIDTNPNVDKNKIHVMYEEVVKALDDNINEMLASYKKVEEESKLVEEEFSKQKRQDFVEMLKKRIQAKEE